MEDSEPPIGGYSVENSISSLRQKVNNIESVSGPSKRTLQLRDEISRLEALLEYSEVKARPSYRYLFLDAVES